MFDPRQTEEYQVAGEPYSRQTGDGEIAAMAIGAALWGTANQTMEAGIHMSKTVYIGCRWGYEQLALATRQPDIRSGTRIRPYVSGLAKRHSRQPGGPEILE